MRGRRILVVRSILNTQKKIIKNLFLDAQHLFRSPFLLLSLIETLTLRDVTSSRSENTELVYKVLKRRVLQFSSRVMEICPDRCISNNSGLSKRKQILPLLRLWLPSSISCQHFIALEATSCSHQSLKTGSAFC